MKKLISLLLILILSLSAAPISFAAREITIYVAGDSTAQTYDAGRAPLTGWAQKLQDYMPDGIVVANHAVSGRSSKSYIDEGRLATVLSSIKEGDYFLIQFGHNDQSDSKETATDTNTTFKEYLKQYIDGAREKKAIPILVSSMERRRFDKKGTAFATLADRAQAMEELAAAENIPYIDIQAETLRWWNYLGPEKTKEIFLYLSAGDSPNYPLGISDDTHLCENGANLVAQLIASKLGETDIDIADKFKNIKSPVPAEAKAPGEEKKEENSEKTDDGVNTPVEEPQEKYDAIARDSVIYRDAAKEARAIGIMNGYADGSLGENNLISRAETAALLSRVFNMQTEGVAAFADVAAHHWAADSIAALNSVGIITGYNGLFYPDNTVSFAELSKMLVEALGYGERAVKIGEYPYGYLTVAAELGITKDIDLTESESVNRGIAAKMLINSLRISRKDGTTIADRVIKNTYYISENGSDENDGSYEKPWLTLKKAADEIKSGDTIILNDGMYDESETAIISADNVQIRCSETGGAKITYPYGKGIVIKGENVKISGLCFEEKAGEDAVESENGAVITVYGKDALLCENEIYGSGILLDGAVNAQISNNIIRDSKAEQIAAISAVNAAENCTIWNNSIISEGYGAISAGIRLVGVNDCSVFNNTVIGTQNGVYFGKGNSVITLRNNIFADCSMDAYTFEEHPKKFNSNYNMFSNTYPRVWEKNSAYSQALFDDTFKDWRLTAKSQATGAGEDLSYSGLDFTDRYGAAPADNWNMGAYQKMSDKIVAVQAGSGGKLLYSENFAKELTDWGNWGGSWKTKNGVLQQITVGGRTLATYSGGHDWKNYFYSADVVSPMLVEGNTTGIVFRADKSMENFYTLRIYEDTHLEFAVWRDGVFESLDKWEYKTESESLYNLAVRANGSSFTFYVNGDEVKTCSDNSHATGSVGCYAYRQMGEFDNVKVESIR
ncbi:MAG: S-layer homology domain-containing protein [Clostridia bacterium]|nr:S-layer homology domain-containing protein [Clostridia bacterium]